MKKSVLILLCLISIAFGSIAQKREIIKAVYKKSYVTESEDPAYVIEFADLATNKKIEFVTSKAPQETSLSFLFWNPEATTSDHTKKDKEGKKFVIVYYLQQNHSEVGVVEEKYMQMCDEIPDDNYPKASCKVYDGYGLLRVVCEGESMFEIRKNKKEDKGTPIQNKNEICRGSKCLKVTVDKDGLVKTNTLPNTTEARTIGKIIGNKLYACKKDDASDVVPERSTFVEFKGDKVQAAIVAINVQFFR